MKILSAMTLNSVIISIYNIKNEMDIGSICIPQLMFYRSTGSLQFAVNYNTDPNLGIHYNYV